jgi:drug/metabolite transporter superfamily protein YnfA
LEYDVYNILADAIVVFHFLFIMFVICGGLLVIRWPKFAFFHLPAAIWGAAVEIFGWICPLTPLENHFRNLAGDFAYRGDFIARHLQPLIYPENLTTTIQQTLGGLVIVVNIIIYFTAIRTHRKVLSH